MAIKNRLSELKTKFIELLLETNCIKFGDFKLKSGAQTTYYVNLREATMYPDLFCLIVELIKEIIPVEKRSKELPEDGDKCKKPVAIVGVPYGVVPIASAVAYECRLAYYPVRKETKDYGYKPAADSFSHYEHILVEDVISTGASIVETIDKLQNKTITDIIVIVDREAGGETRLKTEYPNIRLHSLLKVSEIEMLKGQKQEEPVA